MRARLEHDPLLDEALHRLPHGAEFRFIERLTSLEPGKSGIGEYKVSGDEWFLRGHFPGQPLFPGVLLVEAAAQLAGIVAESDPHVCFLSELRLAGIRSIKFFGAAVPGDVIRFEAAITGRFGNVIQADVSAFVQERTIMKGTLGSLSKILCQEGF